MATQFATATIPTFLTLGSSQFPGTSSYRQVDPIQLTGNAEVTITQHGPDSPLLCGNTTASVNVDLLPENLLRLAQWLEGLGMVKVL